MIPVHLLFLLVFTDNFYKTKSYYYNLQPWSLARGGRRGKFLRKFDVLEEIKFVPYNELSNENMKNLDLQIIEEVKN